MRSPLLTVRRFVVLSSILLLTSCGGGGSAGGSNNPGPSASNSAPLSAITTPSTTPAVGRAVQLDGAGSYDPEGSALTYKWSLVVPAGSSATLAASTEVKATFTPDIAGAYTANLVVNDGAKDSTAASATVAVGALVTPAIQIDKPEPLSDTVKLSLSGTVNGGVTWYVDLKLLGTGDALDNYSVPWTTNSVANGTHQLLVRIQTDTNTFQELQKTITVSNSTISISASASDTTGIIKVDARASSLYGITSVSAKLDGKDLGTLNQPNACSRYCVINNDVYRYTFDAATVGSGSRSIVITATDGSAASKSTTLIIPINNAPVLTVSSPSDGALVSGTLRIIGTASSEKTGAVTTTVTLGDVQIFSTQGNSFDTAYSLSGVTPGPYALTVKSADSSGLIKQVVRTIVVTSSSTLAYSVAFTLPAGAQILAAEGSKILYSLPDGGVILRDLQSSAEVALSAVSAIQYARYWQVSGGRVYALAQDTDCTLRYNYCVYEWSPSGVRKNLSLLSPFADSSLYPNAPVVRNGYAIWVNSFGTNVGSYTLYDLTSQTFTKIDQPASANYLGNTDYDFSVANGVVDFWYWGQTGGSGASGIFDIFNWRSDTATSTRITTGNSISSIYPQVAQARAVWRQSPVGGSTDSTYTLVTQDGVAGAAQPLGSSVTAFKAKGSVVAWLSNEAGGVRSLKALTASGTTTLSNLSSATLYANDSGFVVYGESGKVYSWNAATGVKTLILESSPTQTIATGGKAIFTINSSVYQVPLN